MDTQRVLGSKMTKWCVMKLYVQLAEFEATCRIFSTVNSKAGNIEIARAAKQCMEECDYLIEDVQKSVSGMEHAFLSGQRSPSNRDLKKLIKHDHEVIEMVTKAVNIANSAELSTAAPDGNAQQLTMRTTQMVTSCKGFWCKSKCTCRSKTKRK